MAALAVVVFGFADLCCPNSSLCFEGSFDRTSALVVFALVVDPSTLVEMGCWNSVVSFSYCRQRQRYSR